MAHHHQMRVEVLTNAQHQSPRVLRALAHADLIGLSIDGANAKVHDAMRAKNGNFQRIQALINHLERQKRPYVVRTIVSVKNIDQPAHIMRLLQGKRMLIRWTLQQFVPVGDGFVNRSTLEISDSMFNQVCEEVKSLWDPSTAEFTTVSESQKVNRYFMLDPAGAVFGRVGKPVNGQLPLVGSIFNDHLSDLAERVSFDRESHRTRYQNWFPDHDHRLRPLPIVTHDP
jgi:sulfatase maturation enzyme AslB (radical SAM superfamily)